MKRQKLSHVHVGGTTGAEFLRSYYQADYYTPDVVVRVNTAEISDRIRRDDKRWPRGQFDPAAQAHYLNQSLRRGLLEAVNQRQLGGPHKFQTALMGVMAAQIILSTPRLTDVAGEMRTAALINVVNSVLAFAIYGLHPRERHWSLFFGIPFDRLAVVHAIAHTTTLVKALDS